MGSADCRREAIVSGDGPSFQTGRTPRFRATQPPSARGLVASGGRSEEAGSNDVGTHVGVVVAGLGVDVTVDENAVDTAAAASHGSWLEAILVSAGISSAAGALAGLVWGGVGGRIAMRVLVLTSDDRVRGVTSDDGFEIGVISFSTIALLIVATVLGAIVGFLYGLIRMVTGGPTWLVAFGFGVAMAAGAGASIVHTDGVDFLVLDPKWLAVGLFVFLPGMWAVTTVVVGQRMMQPGVMLPTTPGRLHQPRWGAIGWLLLASMTVAGVLDLIDDVSYLT